MRGLERQINRIERQIESHSGQDEYRLRCLAEIASIISPKDIPTKLLSSNPVEKLKYPSDLTLANILASVACNVVEEKDGQEQ